MKIGILTFHDAHNYGAVLQAYGLKKYLKNIGHDAVVINYHHKNIPDGFPKKRKMIKGDSLKEIYAHFNKMRCSHKSHLLRWNKFNKFINELTNNCKYVYDSEEELSNLKDIDVWICGSDQIWNPDITRGLNKGFFLHFETKAKKISYATSMGIEKLDEKYEKDFEKYINNLDHISVREEQLQQYARSFTKKTVEKVVDPTLLVEKEEYNELIIPIKKQNYLLIYALGPDDRLTTLAKKIAKEKDLVIVELNTLYKKKYEFEQVSDAGPEEFVSLIKNADYIITNSYHGTIFSMIFNKEFYVITRKNRNSRMETLLKTAGISERLLDDDIQIELNKKIDYKEVEEKLKEESDKSKKFLEEALKI